MSCYSASTFTQSAPQVSSGSLQLDEDIRAAAKTCTGVERHVAEIAAFLIKELKCSVPAERDQDPLPFFISRIVKETTPYVLDMGGVISAAHILVMRLCESYRSANRSAGAEWSGHQLFLSAFAFAAQEQPVPHAAKFLNTCAFWSELSGFTVVEVTEIQRRLSDELEGRVHVFRDAMEKVMQSPLMQLQARWRQEDEEWRREDEEIRLEKRRRPFRRLAGFFRSH